MRHFDFTPLYRATVGFDQIADMVDRVLTSDVQTSSYPPYNIEKIDKDTYLISVAVAGFSEADLSVEVKENSLIISAGKSDEEKKKFLHRGIASRSFKQQFQMADHVQVTGANHSDGMLHIELKREVPEALKPRQIPISRGSSILSNAKDRVIEALAS
jgi:molecular chaperone IbpA